ncbi:MAG: hypothetical protein KBG92_10710 [Spirochaetes bacterium]|nr:hypothetical protein [Spirochaetota bacterium]MBP8988270.1 hypothetical protein [Spirochaetota bacterium]
MKQVMQIVYMLFFISLLLQKGFPQTMADEPLSDPFSQAKFVPDIAAIVDVTYVQRSLEDFTHYGIPGFKDADSKTSDHENHEDELNQNNGFNLNYAEISFYSQVDPFFDMFAVLHASTEGAEIEEAYFTTQQLPFGFKIKGGKFLSSIGRLNDKHAHYWDFADLPLVYKAFFGSQLNEIGIQLDWIVPLPFYVLLGAEALRGENETSFGTNGFTVENITTIDDANKPNVYTAFVKSSFDISNFTVLAGASGIYGTSRIDHGIGNDTKVAGDHGFYGKTYMAIGDITIRYDFNSYQYIYLQTEYIYRNQDGDLYSYDGSINSKSNFDAKQSGLYTQVVARLNQLWRIGLRYDLLAQNDVNTHHHLTNNLPRYSSMIEYNPSEFSRFRLQYNYDKSLYSESGTNKPNHEIIVQANITIGAHGAHSF